MDVLFGAVAGVSAGALFGLALYLVLPTLKTRGEGDPIRSLAREIVRRADAR